MAAALALAERELGDTWPNPSVGCVIARNAHIVGRGWTRSGGRPHAEAEALKMAGAEAKGATAYVTLEPCSHHGRTPPCADALIEAGIVRVVSAATDPDPRVVGGGHARLRAAGLVVDEGLGRVEAERINRGFILRNTAKRPLFALKVATSVDGRIALKSGASRWITGERARAAGHSLRSRHDAILVGSETVLADNPSLNCRLPGYAGRPKLRIVLDRRGRVGAAHRVTDASLGPSRIYRQSSGSAGAAEVRILGGDPGEFLAAAASDMAASGLTRVLIEGGGTVAAAFLKAGLIDEVAWFSSGLALGSDARPALGQLDLDQLTDAHHFVIRHSTRIGEDVLTVLDRP
ncbi:MAG: bifunctional diaminohydroxyphosphoribosylaminopyrimidine deaminase/5-amino-6-(5-phosphoribosylamino)uracil reductase RibD [Alphaproteobacteria bacterium]|nr:bifunctional diaminohydroxyphosphoribosylaminopyrimidine deaminase/5-amino-6-(5-phosphoribosylamino)uracil reductase RibD [Alphaproteobacteria bacterium]